MHAAWLAGLLKLPKNHIRIFMHGFGDKHDIYHHYLYQKFNCVFPTRLTHSQSKERLPIPEKRRHFQYFGVPLARKVPKKSWNSPLTLVSLSRIEPAKRICELVEAVINAFQMNPSLQERFVIKIFGKPHDHDMKGQEYLRQLRQMVPHQLTTKILFPGFTNEPNLILEQAHFLFFTSQNEFYGFSLLEALATGTPTITVRQGSFTELNQENYGRFIDLENPESVQKVLEEINNMTALEYKALQDDARNRAEAEFDISKTTDQFRQWLTTH
jgi:glycosyltransferase involved in cell wall biosynthesis